MAGGNNVARMSPRQRMINLMYIVLTAMLALNVSSDVLNGFSQVQSGLQKTTENLTAKNAAQYLYLKQLYDDNPQKVGPWLAAGTQVHESTDSLYKAIETLKIEIARQADGPQADYRNLVNNDDLEASSAWMLNPVTQRGAKLRQAIDAYRKQVLTHITDPDKRKAAEQLLSTAVATPKGSVGPVTWEQVNFENMPVIAAVTFLTHLQTNIRQTESDAMTSIINNIDMGDMRVNSLNAYVIPQSTMIMQGGRYSADIVLAAVDTTKRPRVFVGGRELKNGRYEFSPGGTGNFDYSGYIEVLKADGSMQKYPFKSSYTVIEPMATISPTMMNVLYAGIDNPISISAPGVPMSAITATMTNGTLTRSGDHWVARSGSVGSEAVISVSSTLDGRTQQLGSMTFRVRKLPDPLPFIAYKDASGNTQHYKGGPRRLAKAALMSASGLGAALDDGVLNITYQVVSFSTVFFDSMGNAIPENSAGASFSARQIEQFKRLKVGKSFFITDIKAKGPDGITREIPPLQVTLN